jgi:hypothetical protein
MTLAKIIAANTTTTNLQPNVFVFNTTISGSVFADRNGNGRIDRNEQGVGAALLSLIDEEGVTVATTTSSRDGNYQFAGVQLGDYTVKMTTTATITTAPAVIDVTRGQAFAGVNFGIRGITTPTPHAAVETAATKTDKEPTLLIELL